MSDDEARQARTAQILKNAERLIAEADAALAAGDRFFAERGIDRTKLDEYVRRMVGEQGEHRVRAQVERAVQELQERAKQASAHQQFDVPPAGRSRRFRHMV